MSIKSAAEAMFINNCIPHTEAEYESWVALLDRLIDQVGEDETHPFASMMDVIGRLIENYEMANVPELEAIGH